MSTSLPDRSNSHHTLDFDCSLCWKLILKRGNHWVLSRNIYNLYKELSRVLVHICHKVATKDYEPNKGKKTYDGFINAIASSSGLSISFSYHQLKPKCNWLPGTYMVHMLHTTKKLIWDFISHCHMSLSNDTESKSLHSLSLMMPQRVTDCTLWRWARQDYSLCEEPVTMSALMSKTDAQA